MASPNGIFVNRSTRDGLEPSALRSPHPARFGRVARLGRGLGALVLTSLLLLTAQATGAADKLIICYVATHSALVPLARLHDFYAAEGLDVEVRSLASGRQTMDAMFAGQCPLSTASENPVAHYSLSRNDFLIIATLSISNNIESVIVRSDKGILTPGDLRGRHVAVPQFTTAHYFLDVFLIANGLAPQEVIKVYLPAQEIVPAFRRGEVDAAALWKPNLQALAEEFGTRAKTFEAAGLHVNPMILIGTRDYVRKNPVTVQRVLRALLRAERFVNEQPASARALVAQSFAIAQSEVDWVWPLHDFHVSLDQSLPFILENAARWEIGLMPLAQRPAMPNYLDFIYVDALRAVKPAAVTIIH